MRILVIEDDVDHRETEGGGGTYGTDLRLVPHPTTTVLPFRNRNLRRVAVAKARVPTTPTRPLIWRAASVMIRGSPATGSQAGRLIAVGRISA